MPKFMHHKYTWSKPWGTISHNWELVGPNGAIDFRVSISETKYGGPSAGLEFHHLSGDGAPNHLECALTGGRCWHDGTTLYAIDGVWPSVEPMLRRGDHDGIFSILEREYTKHFEREVEAE
jgi:hypothetical protein